MIPQKSVNYIYFQSKHAPGKVIDISQELNTIGNAVLYDYHKSPNQHFELVPCADNGYFHIQSQLSNKVLTILGHNDANGSMIVEEANNGKDAQKFKIEEVSQGTKEYYIFTHFNKALDICNAKNKNDSPIIQYELHGQPNQVWKIRYV